MQIDHHSKVRITNVMSMHASRDPVSFQYLPVSSSSAIGASFIEDSPVFLSLNQGFGLQIQRTNENVGLSQCHKPTVWECATIFSTIFKPQKCWNGDGLWIFMALILHWVYHHPSMVLPYFFPKVWKKQSSTEMPELQTILGRGFLHASDESPWRVFHLFLAEATPTDAGAGFVSHGGILSRHQSSPPWWFQCRMMPSGNLT